MGRPEAEAIRSAFLCICLPPRAKWIKGGPLQGPCRAEERPWEIVVEANHTVAMEIGPGRWRPMDSSATSEWGPLRRVAVPVRAFVDLSGSYCTGHRAQRDLRPVRPGGGVTRWVSFAPVGPGDASFWHAGGVSASRLRRTRQPRRRPWWAKALWQARSRPGWASTCCQSEGAGHQRPVRRSGDTALRTGSRWAGQAADRRRCGRLV
jgi:hypothetical protein